MYTNGERNMVGLVKKTKTKHFFPSLYVFQELSEWGTFQNDVIIKMHDVALSNIFNEQYQC